MAPISLAPFLALSLFFSFPFPLWYPQCYLQQPPHILLIILYLQYLNRFSPYLPPLTFFFLGAFPPLPSSFFSFFLSATGPFNFGGKAYRLPGKKRAGGRREGDGGREKPGRQRRAWLMPFKRGSLACQIAGCRKKNELAYLFGLPRDVMQHSFIFLDKTQ